MEVHITSPQNEGLISQDTDNTLMTSFWKKKKFSEVMQWPFFLILFIIFVGKEETLIVIQCV